MNTIIIGDKYQKGMKSRGCPGLLKINKTTNIIEQQYTLLRKSFDDNNITYVGGFEFRKLQNFLTTTVKDKAKLDIKLLFNEKYEEYNELHALSLAIDEITDDTIIMSGYTVLDKKTLYNLNKQNYSQVMISKHNTSKSPGCIIDHNSVTNISFDLPNSIVNSFFIKKKDVHILKEYLQNSLYRNYFLFEIINKLIDEQVIFKPLFVSEKSYE